MRPSSPPTAWPRARPCPCIRHHLPTRGLVFAYRYFDMNGLDFEDLPYAAVLGIVLGKLGTDAHSAAEIDTLTNGKLGNCSFFCEVYEDERQPRCRDAHVRGERIGFGRERRMAGRAAERDLGEDRLRRHRQDPRRRCSSAASAWSRASPTPGMQRPWRASTSYFLPAGVVRQQLGGVDFHRFLVELLG